MTPKLPEQFCARMKTLLGDEYDAFIASYEKPRHLSLRVNPLKCTDDEYLHMITYRTRPVPWADHGYYYDPDAHPGKSALHEAGLYYIQEASAMIAAQISGARPGERVLDLCAAPGGKSTQLAGMMGGRGLLISNEIHPQRAKILSRNIERLGITNCIVTNESPEELADHFPAFFDRIVVDAPCSGEGMFRKEEAAIPNWSLNNIRHCAERQKEILNCAAQMLKTGGTLVYSTCTFAPEENEEQIAGFLKDHPAFQQVSLREEIGPEKFDRMGLAAGTDEKSARLFPHRLDGEGHFVAKLINGDSPASAVSEGSAMITGRSESRTSDAPLSRRKKNRNAPSAGQNRRNSASGLTEVLNSWKNFEDQYLTDTGKAFIEGEPILFGSDLYLLPEPISLEHLKVLRPGLHLGTFKKGRFEPAHALALALKKEDLRQLMVLSDEGPEVRAFLRGESLPVDRNLKGWTAVLVNGKTLGWVKASNGMLKNHYPKGLRIL